MCENNQSKFVKIVYMDHYFGEVSDEYRILENNPNRLYITVTDEFYNEIIIWRHNIISPEYLKVKQ